MFLFLLIAMVVVVAAVTLAVIGGDRAVLPEAAPQQLVDPLPETRPVGRADIDALRLPVAPRGYRMADVDDALSRLGAELAERDARIAELESELAGAQAAAVSRSDLFDQRGFTQPGFNQQGFNRPGSSQPGYNHSGYNQPGLDQPGFTEPGEEGER